MFPSFSIQNSGNILGDCCVQGEIDLFSRSLQSSKHHNENFLEDGNEDGARPKTYRCVIPSLARQPILLKLMRYTESWPNWKGVCCCCSPIGFTPSHSCFSLSISKVVVIPYPTLWLCNHILCNRNDLFMPMMAGRIENTIFR